MTETIASLQATIGADTSGFVKGLGQVREGLGGIGQQMGGLANITKMVFGGSVVGALTAAVTGASAFDKSMKNIQAVTNRSAGEMAGLSAELLRIGSTSAAGPQAIADTFYDIVGGVADASTHMAILRAALDTSKAGAADLGATTKGLIAIMNGYSLGADKASYVSDVLTKTVGVGVGSMDEFVGAIGPLVGIMSSVGEPIDRVGAAMAYMTTKGVSASQAATQLKAATTSLLNPNAEMIKLFKKAGIASGSAALKQYGLAGVLGKLKTAAGGSADAMAKALGSVEALSAATLLNSADFETALGNFEEGYQGATAAAAAIQGTSFAATFDSFKSAVSGAAISIGNLLLPPLGILIQVATAVVQYVSQMNPIILALGAAALIAMVAIGPLVAGIAAILSPVGLVVIAVAAIAVAFNENFGGIRDIVIGAYNSVKPELDKIGAILTEFWQTIFPSEKTAPKYDPSKQYGTGFMKKGQGGEAGDYQQHTMNPGQTQQQPEFITRVLNAISTAAPKLVQAITDFINMGVAWITTNGPKLISDAVTKIFELADTIGEKAKTFVTDVSNFIGKGVAWLISNAPALVQGAIQTVLNVGPVVISAANWFIRNLTGFVMKAVNWLIDTGKGLISGAIGGLLGVDPKVIETKITEFLKPIQDALSDPKGTLQTAIEAAKTLVQGFIDKFNDIRTGLTTAFAGLIDIVTAPFKSAIRWIGELLKKAGAFGGVFAGLTGVGQGLIDAADGGSWWERTAAIAQNAIQNATGTKAAGGSVIGGSKYLVGEKGPEMFVPGRSGTIIPNNVLMGGGGGGGRGTVIIQQLIVQGVQDVRELWNALEEEAGHRNVVLGVR